MPKESIEVPTNAYLPKGKELEIRKWIYKRFDEMRWSQVRQDAEKEWALGDRAWEAVRRHDLERWQSNYFVPLTTSVVESIISELVDQNIHPLILPRGREDLPKVKVMKHVYDFTWDIGDGNVQLNDIYRAALIRGTAFAQEFYFKDKRMVRDIKGLSEKTKRGKKNKKKREKREFLTEEREVLEFDDVYMEYVPNCDIFWDEQAVEFNRGTKKSRDAIRRFIMNYRDAKIFFSGPVWDPMNNFRFVKPGKPSNFYECFNPNTRISTVVSQSTDVNFNHEEDVEVLWYWSRKPEDLMVVVINDVVIRMGPNIYKHKMLPFAKAVDVKRLDNFCGKGEPALLDSIQSEVNLMRQMITDRNHLDIDKSFLISQNSMLSDEDLISRPHAAITVDDPSNVRPLEYNDIPLSVDRTLKAIGDDSIRVTGVDDRFQALQKSPATATEAAILKESTLKRIKMKVDNFRNGFMVDISRMRVANIQQFYSQPRLERIAGSDNTQDFKREMAQLANEGLLEIREGKPFKKSFREVRIDGSELIPNERGEIIERQTPGFSFFTANPKFFLPTHKMGFDIRYGITTELPISKPLAQSKAQELFDRLIPLTETTNYDAEKIADKVVEVNDFNPEELKSEESVQEETLETNRVEIALDLAAQENQLVLEGKEIPQFGTPFAPPAHTLIHINFLRSEQMKNAPEEVFMKLLTHTQGEVTANQQRAGVGVPTPGDQQSQQSQQPALAGAGVGQGAQDVIPALVQGGNQVPTGRAIGNG